MSTRTLRRRTKIFYVAVVGLASMAAVPAQDDVELSVTKTATGDVQLGWSGGDPRFDVYRDVDPERVLDATSRIGTTTETFLADAPPLGSIHFYRVVERGTCYAAFDDAFVDAAQPAATFGAAPTLEVSDQGPERRSYLAFSIDAVPAGAVVVSAKLELPYAGAASSQARTVVHEAAGPWQSDTVTYSSQPGPGQQIDVNFNAPGGTWRRFSLEDLVQSWVDGSAENNGIVVKADLQGVTNVSFHSLEAGLAERPRLCVTWSEPQAEGLAPIADDVETIEFDDDGRVAFLAGAIPIASPASTDPVVLALQFLQENALLFGLDDPQAELFLDRYDATGARHTVVFAQRHPDANVPFHAASISVQLLKSEPTVVLVAGRYARDVPDFSSPPVSRQQAAKNGLEHVGDGTSIRGDVVLENYGSDLLLSDGGPVRPRWRMIVDQADPLTESYGARELLVDGYTGQVVLDSELGEAAHDGTMDLSVRANDGPDDTCWYSEATELYTEDGEAPTYDPALDPFVEADVGAIWAQEIWDLAHDRYGYEGWDDGSEQIRIAIGQDVTQSSRDCGAVKFEAGWLVDDVLAHEWMHMIDNHTARLIYRHETGAIDEAFADIFGTFIDPQDWRLGEDIACTNPDACGCARRDMSDPPLCGSYVDHFDDFLTGSWDSHRVHGNSSIINKAYYLMVEGDTHRGTTVSSIPRSKAELLFWHTHVGAPPFAGSVLPRNATFRQLANALVYWTGILSFTPQESCQVINALHAVGIMAPDSDCDGVPDGGFDPDGDGKTNAVDNCPNISNPSQADIDGDQLGDACDLDIDGDGLENVKDNCVYVFNPDQSTGSPEGSIGIACLDTDRDGVFDLDDNCPAKGDRNPMQEDTDGDGTGDVCDNDDDNDGFDDGNDPCPLVWNADLANPDGDGIPDECDNCPTFYNADQSNIDLDELGDRCDPDQDGDGVPEGIGTNPCEGPSDTNCDDNCPTIPNGDQTDGDGDGVGQRCDVDELLDLEAQKNQLVEANVLVALLAGDIARFEIAPCRSDCPDWLADDFWTKVSVSSSVPLDARIVDERGFVVHQAATNATGDVVLQFDVDPEYRYVSPALGTLPYAGAAAEQPVELKTYFLELRLAAGIAEAVFDGGITVESNFSP